MWCVGIDPGLKSTGVAALHWRDLEVDDVRTTAITTATSPDFFRRSNHIATELSKWIDATIGAFDLHCVVEYPHNTRNSKAYSHQSGLFGILGRELWRRRGTVMWLCHPSQLKKFVTGRGVGKKEDIKLEVYKRWKFEHPSNDVVDAYAIAQLASCITLMGRGPFTQVQKQVAERVVTPQKYKKRRTR